MVESLVGGANMTFLGVSDSYFSHSDLKLKFRDKIRHAFAKKWEIYF